MRIPSTGVKGQNNFVREVSKRPLYVVGLKTDQTAWANPPT